MHILLLVLLQLISCKNSVTPEESKSITSKVVYGRDDRTETIHSDSEVLKDASKSVAGMVVKSAFRESSANKNYYSVKRFDLKDLNLSEDEEAPPIGLCRFERFRRQPTLALCSGFLISENLLMTAGHCIRGERDCEAFSWIFDYDITTIRTFKKMWFKKKSLYHCKKIIKREEDPIDGGLDYAIIELDRPVKDREPLKLNLTNEINIDAEVALIGHPDGVPLKIAPNGRVLSKDINTLVYASVDSFTGNSGGPLLSQRSGVVEGILVSGAKDYYESDLGCMKVNRCKAGECAGEVAVLLSSIPILKTLLEPL